jgi:4-oxalocrotonate tautomerase
VAFVQITCAEGRTQEVKKALYARIAALVAATGAVLAADVVINLLEVKRENWSFGNGVAQYVN